MNPTLILLSVPGLRNDDVGHMPCLSQLMAAGERAPLIPSFPAVTWPVQSNMLTGKTPTEHGVVANGFYWRDEQRVEMWTAGNEKIQASQVWDVLKAKRPQLTSAAWFPMLSKGCGADYICMPAPIHNPDGSESLWCYSRPTEFYGELRDRLGHFPLQNFWGPMASIPSTAWIVDSAVVAAQKWKPDFFYLYLPHLDYAAQKSGPDSKQAKQALVELDAVLGKLRLGFGQAYGDAQPIWLVASEYTIAPVSDVMYPNRVLREAGLLTVEETDQGERLDFERSSAWCLVDHQFSHVFVRDADPEVVTRVVQLFDEQPGVAEVLSGEGRATRGMQHARSGEVILISRPESWQAYYWWLDNSRAPGFARTVDIHRKPGYDPVELCLDPATKSIPLDATLVRGSHGAPVARDRAEGVLLSSLTGMLGDGPKRDVDIAAIVLSQFGLKP